MHFTKHSNRPFASRCSSAQCVQRPTYLAQVVTFEGEDDPASVEKHRRTETNPLGELRSTVLLAVRFPEESLLFELKQQPLVVVSECVGGAGAGSGDFECGHDFVPELELLTSCRRGGCRVPARLFGGF